MKKGFTLIEVLIAMMIIAIAFAAVLKATEQTTLRTIYLKKKVEAHWVAVDLINQVQADMIALNSQGQSSSGHANMFNLRWDWKMKLSPTLNKNVDTITLTLSQNGKQVESMTAVKSNQLMRQVSYE